MATVEPVLVQKGDKKMWCGVCGMNLKMFYKTSYIAGDKQYCSVRCLVADDMKNHNIDFGKVEVIDAETQKPILAKDAVFVVGSDVKGTMSRVSKLAFSTKTDAKEFIKTHGGELATFDEVLKMAKDTLKKDSKMVMMKKQKMMYPMGEKILAKKCNGAEDDINPSQFKAINELKAYIKDNNICKNIKEKQLQAVALYLWDKKRAKGGEANLKIEITQKEKCPVCGMFVYKYPKWTAQIVYQGGEKFSFDGVKDMMKFYFDRNSYGEYNDLTKDKIADIIVTDYYSQKPIDGIKAYYVIGSDVNGPMGEELIPFSSIESAKTFLQDHHGKKILKFSEITPDYLK
jgi:nitrous oxide reductase accessory protein NosL